MTYIPFTLLWPIVSKMWSHIGLCLLVGFAFASKNSGWKDNTEYVYSIRGRTLTSLHEVSNEYTGILFKAKLVIHPRSDGKLNAKISDAHYAQVHSELENGWNTYIPDSELNYKSMDMSDHPFQIQLEDGVIQDLLVDKSVSNWESNIIKGIVSQFQLNINGASYQGGYSGGNPSGQSGNSEGGNSYVFKTMEETVTGNVETWYDIHPLPEYTLHKRPWISRLLELRGNGDVIEVVKSKNYTNNYELPSYHYGMFGNHDWQPATNQMGTFFVRGSISRAILTGNMNRYTVQNSYTVNEIMISPTMNDKQKGSVVSLLNVTLEDANSQGENIPEVSNPRSLGGLVYTYDKPYSQSNEAGVRKSSQRNYGNGDFNRFQRSFVHRTTGSSEESEGSSIYWHTSKMGRRSPNQGNKYGQGSGSSGEASEYWQLGEFFKQDNPKMQEAPEFPLLPYSTGYQGKSIKNGGKVNMAESVKKIAKDIANDFKNPEEYLRKGSLNKFTIMTSLVRILNFDELQQVASDLYSPPSRKSQYDAWAAFRDAVAEAGTGPAFLIIQDSIQSKKIKGNEAAEIVATMSRAVRVPNPEYMQTYFNFIKKREVQYEEYLNETALMSFSTLVRNVYVDIKKSKNEYPVRSFGNFRTNEGLKMVDHVVGYLTQQLHEAVSRADTQKIHTYIRALGNVGHPKILSAFEPYLEGQKQASQFQRFLMVAAMDHLSEIYPTDAQEVLFKVYQNAGETQEVRMAAVCQLIRTDPPTRMLQRMASYTNIDNQEQVNAAVKSAIESGAELEGYEHQSFRFSAQAAKPLLTKKSYGFQHGYNYLNNYVVKELQFDVTHGVNSIGSNDDYYPKGLKYSTHVNVGGLTKRLGTAHAIVSSIQELIHVGNMQTASYRKQMDEQERNADQQQQEKYSSQKIAHLFNMKADEYEQLEGNFYVELGDYFQKMISFDNHTAEQWVEDIRKYQEELRNGKNCHYTKLTNSREMAISFPTEMGLPFLFTYDTPTLYKVEGDLKGDSSPQVSMNNKLYLPDTAYVKSNLEVTVNYKIQSRLSFLTPFDHQQYIAGFDKNFHVHFPLYGTVEVDFKNGQAKAEIDVQKWHKGELLFHYSSWPYTSRTDIKEFQPISLNKNTHYIKQTNYRNYERVFGKKETGMAMHVKICHERESMSLTWLYRLMQEYGVMGGALTLWDDSSIQHSEISVRHLADKSSVHKCVVHMGFRQKYKSQTEGGTESGTESNSDGFSDFSSSDFSEFPQNSDPLGRQDDLINKLSDGISNAYVQVGDLTVEFQGENNIQHSITGGYGKSNVDPKSRMMFHYKKNSKGQDVKPYEASFQAVSKIPNTNALDLKFSMQREPRADTKFQFKFGTTQQSSSEIHGLMKWRRSESRKQYLQDYPLYQQCQREMRGGDYQLPACANATMTANLLNRANVNIHYKNVKPDIVETVEAIYNAFQVNYYPSLQFKNKGTGKEKEINLQYELDPDLRFANFTVATSNEETTINNIEVGEWGRTLFAAHPVFHVRSRVMSTIFGLQTYRPICVVDKAHISTFSNRTYPASLDKHWTVALQYIPQDARHYEEPKSVQEQLRTQPENFVVFVRQSGQGRDVKITFSSPETDYKLMDITMGSGQGSSGMKTKVNVNGQEVQVSGHSSHDIGEGYVQIYGLPNGEVKVEVRDWFYVISDGERMKLTALNGRFRNSVRGLCGVFNDDEANDFLTPENCIVGNYKQFIKSYDIESGEGRGQTQKHSKGSHECVPKEVPLYADVISNRLWSQRSQRSGDCTMHQTRYVEEDGQICFTIGEMPVCRDHCRQRGTITNNVPVHCVKNSNAAQLWRKQINQGQSPDFGHKKETKITRIELPQSCVP